MKIETLGDWNGINTGCGCCPMPEAPGPARLSECKSITRGICGEYITVLAAPWEIPPCPFIGRKYRAKKRTITITRTEVGGDPATVTWSETTTVAWGYNGAGICTFDWNTVTEGDTIPGTPVWADEVDRTQGGDYFYNLHVYGTDPDESGNTFDMVDRIEYLEGVTGFTEYLHADVLAALEGEDWEECSSDASYTVIQSTNPEDCFDPVVPVVVSGKISRYRWKIPHTHAGPYFKITWDVATEVEEGASTLESDLTWQFSGPGTGDEYDPSWLSDWYELALPDDPAERKVVNIRYEGIRSSRMGMKPQLMGDPYVLPPIKPKVRTARTGKSGDNRRSAVSKISSGKSGGTALKIGGLKIGGLKMSGLRMGGLKIGTLRMPTLRMGGLKISGLKDSGGLKIKGLKIGGLKNSGGLKIKGLKVTGVKSSTGIKVSGIKVKRLQGSSGLKSSGGLKRTAGLKTKTL